MRMEMELGDWGIQCDDMDRTVQKNKPGCDIIYNYKSDWYNTYIYTTLII